MKIKIVSYLKISLVSFIFIPLTYSCSGTAANVQITPTPTPKLPLFLRLGNNKEALSVIVDDLFLNVAADTTINTKFKDLLNDAARLKKFKDNLVTYMCKLSAGGCTFTPDPSQQPISLDTNEYTTFKGNLTKTLDKFKVLAGDKNDLNLLFDPQKDSFFLLTTPTPAPSLSPSASSPGPSVSGSPTASGLTASPQITSSTPISTSGTVQPFISPTPTVMATPR